MNIHKWRVEEWRIAVCVLLSLRIGFTIGLLLRIRMVSIHMFKSNRIFCGGRFLSSNNWNSLPCSTRSNTLHGLGGIKKKKNTVNWTIVIDIKGNNFFRNHAEVEVEVWCSMLEVSADVTVGRNCVTKYSMIHETDTRVIEHVKHFRDLGIQVSEDLKWSQQCNQAASKAMSVLGMIRRAFGKVSKENSFHCRRQI